MKNEKLLRQALADYQSGRTEKARIGFLTLVKSEPRHQDAHYYLGRIARDQGDLRQSAVYFEKACQSGSNSENCWIAYIETLIGLEDRKAVKALMEASRRGLAGEQANRLKAEIKAKFTPLEKPLMLGEIRPLSGTRFGQRRPVILAALYFPAPDRLKGIGEIRSLLSALLNVRLTHATADDQSLASAYANLTREACLAWQDECGFPVFDPGWVRPAENPAQTGFWLVLPYDDADSSVLLLKFVVACLNSLLETPQSNDALRKQVEQLQEHIRPAALKPSLMYDFLRAAAQRGIPWLNLFGSYYQFGYGARARMCDYTITDRTAGISAAIARNKTLTLKMLKQAGLPVPAHIPVANRDEAMRAAEIVGYPVVVKPADQDAGHGVRSNLSNARELAEAYAHAAHYSTNIAVEQHIPGICYRMHVVGGKLFQAHYSSHAGVTGDGHSTIAQLAEDVNRDPRRGTSPKYPLVALVLNEEVKAFLQEQGLTPDAVVEAGRFVPLHRVANSANGGVPIDILDSIHPDNKRLAERAVQALGLDIGGVDFITEDISKSWLTHGGAINEVNGKPRFRPVAMPEIYDRLLDWLLQGSNGRIPIAAVIAENGAARICRLLHAMLSAQGLRTGVSCSAGSWLGRETLTLQNGAGYAGGRLLLTDRQTEAAVIELPPQAILNQGFPYDLCDVAALIGLPAGFDAELQRAEKMIVVNAEDAACLDQLQGVEDRKILLLSRQRMHPALDRHLASGHTGAWLEEGTAGVRIRIGNGETALHIAVPETAGSRKEDARFDALAACGLAYAMDCPAESIRQGLADFFEDGTADKSRRDIP